MASSGALSYNDVASKLLKDKLLLTALELHTELLESGKEVKELKDFFSNPGNFESQTQEISSRISRSGSQTTLDSLDFTRFSEDGERSADDKIAVLEFELRKAKETITALRNNLTVATESENKSPDKASLKQINNDIKPHEQRALNFLINEYLLLHGYKLTSITFADENENQDFEDWDDVGLNIAKPAELLTLYREGLKQTGCNLTTVSIQTDIKDVVMETKIVSLNKDIELLNRKLKSIETELESTREENLNLTRQLESSQKSTPPQEACSKTSTIGSDSPEHFELLDKAPSEADNVSNTSITAEWTRVNKTDEDYNNKKNDAFIFVNKAKSERFKNELLNMCPVKVPDSIDNEIFVNTLSHGNTLESLVQVASESLLRIIPNIILNKREEAIPLLISTIKLNQASPTREKLLQQLFNLKKKPSEAERALILNGILGVAKCCPETVVENEILPLCWEQLTHKHVERRHLVVESCRILIPYVSSPIRNSLMLSMLQQMLDDKEESVREEVIKVLALLVGFCEDVDKYGQCEELAFNTLKDSSEQVVKLAVELLFPIVAKWSFDSGKLRNGLIKNLLQRINDALKNIKDESPNKHKLFPDVILRIISVLNTLLPFLLISVANSSIVLDRIEKDMIIDLRPELLNICTNMTNPNNFYTSNFSVGMILYEFDKLFDQSNEYTWNELEWLTETVFPDLLNSLNLIDITQHVILQSFMDLFSNICIVFGRNFTTRRIRPLLQTQVQSLEAILPSFNQYSPSLNIIPVYVVSVLSYCDAEEAEAVLSRFVCAMPLYGAPLDCLEVTVRGLCKMELQELVLNSLWQGVVHQRPLVRGVTAGLFATIIGTCNEGLLNVKVTPALVTLANDTDMLVRTATVPALGSLITDCTMQELHDKAYMQLQMFLSDPATQDNHTLLRQMVVTMGNIVCYCKQSFRQDVILPQLAAISQQMALLSNHSRKVDMAVALIESYSNVIYSQFNNNVVSNIVLPGLRCLEQAISENPTLHTHKDAINQMIKECETRYDLSSPTAEKIPSSASKITQNVNQSVEEMKQRMSKMFNKPPGSAKQNLSTLQGFFKKK